VTDNASEIASIMSAAMGSIMLGEKDAQTALTEANAAVNATFK
jgi:ABC-type glycerol-3-phosphate transport system substrate-binding protein